MRTSELFEMAKPAATCDKCGKGPINKTHYWYKGAWKCKGAGKSEPAKAEEKKAEDKPVEKKPAPAKQEPKKAETQQQKSHHEPPKMSQAMRDANEKSADARQRSFIAQLKKERGIKDDDDDK